MKINVVIGVLVALALHATIQSLKPMEASRSAAVATPAVQMDMQAAKSREPLHAANIPTTQSVRAAALQGDGALANDSNKAQFWIEEEWADLPEHRVDGSLIDSRPVTIDRRSLTSLQVGDRVELNIPQLSARYAARIDQIVEHGNGDLSWHGHLTEYEGPYAVIMTMGDSASFATIATPEGTFMLEAADSSGWMVAMADLDNLIDTNLQDYQVPAIQR